MHESFTFGTHCRGKERAKDFCHLCETYTYDMWHCKTNSRVVRSKAARLLTPVLGFNHKWLRSSEGLVHTWLGSTRQKRELSCYLQNVLNEPIMVSRGQGLLIIHHLSQIPLEVFFIYGALFCDDLQLEEHGRILRWSSFAPVSPIAQLVQLALWQKLSTLARWRSFAEASQAHPRLDQISMPSATCFNAKKKWLK